MVSNKDSKFLFAMNSIGTHLFSSGNIKHFLSEKSHCRAPII